MSNETIEAAAKRATTAIWDAVWGAFTGNARVDRGQIADIITREFADVAKILDGLPTLADGSKIVPGHSAYHPQYGHVTVDIGGFARGFGGRPSVLSRECYPSRAAAAESALRAPTPTPKGE